MMHLVVPQIRRGGVDTVFVMVRSLANIVRYQLTNLIAVRVFPESIFPLLDRILSRETCLQSTCSTSLLQRSHYPLN